MVIPNLVASLTIGLGLYTASAVIAAESPSTANSGLDKFREFLANPPSVKKVVYDEVGLRSIMITEGKAPVEKLGFATYEASVQPESFYLKLIRTSLYDKHPNHGPGFVHGRSGKMFWSLSADQSTIAFSHAEAGSLVTNPVERLVHDSLERVSRILSLGVNHLQPGSLVWQNESQFLANAAWNMGQLSGAIIDSTGGLPRMLRYQVEKASKLECKAYYFYRDGRDFPPETIVRSVIANGHEQFVETNRIIQLEIGIYDTELAGFTPTYFRTATAPPKIIMQSNGLSYFIRADGSLQYLRDGAPSLPPAANRGVSLTARAVLIVITLLIILALCIIVAKHRTREKQRGR